MGKNRRILWIDDEIELLESHAFLLRQKGYDVVPAASGHDGLSLLSVERFDAVLLDQIMPGGMDGLTTLTEIRKLEPTLPVIMVTKNQDMSLIADAVMRQVDDFLVKPLTPCQISSTLTFILEQSEFKERLTIQNYVEDYKRIQTIKHQALDWRTWVDIYVKLTEWDVKFDELTKVDDIRETHTIERQDCNALFAKHVEENYRDWLFGIDSPILSVDVFSKYVVPQIERGRQVFFIVMDCLRLDQWLVLESILRPYFRITRHYYYSILPTSTLYSRNALFSGLFPVEIEKRYPKLWCESDDEHSSINRFEKDLLMLYLERLGLILKPRARYFKIFDARGEIEYLQWLSTVEKVSLAALVVDFLDIFTHKRSEITLLKELTHNEAAFRGLTEMWFLHSRIYEIFKVLSQRNAVIVLTTDHGSILSQRAARVLGDKSTSSGLRFKLGNRLTCDDPGAALYIDEPEEYNLPKGNLDKDYLLAKEDYYFVYPNQFNEYKRQFHGGFQHGGITMEEMILPCVVMTPRG